MDQIRDLLNNISDLTPEQLTELSTQILAEFDTYDSQEVTTEVIASMTELADALDTVNAEMSTREALVQELSAQKEAAVSRIRGENLEENDETVADEDTTSKELSDEDDEAKKAASVVETPEAEFTAVVEEPVIETIEPEAEVVVPEAEIKDIPDEASELSTSDETASSEEEVSSTVEEPAKVETELSATEADAPASDEGAGVEEAELSTRKDSEAVSDASVNDQSPLQAPDSHRPVQEESKTARASLSITAGGDITGISDGAELPDMKAVANAMLTRMHSIRRTSGGNGETFSVATLHFDYPEDRTLFSGDVAGNNRKVEAVASPEAIVAAGGFCAPVEVSYDIFGFGVTDRPVKDALATFAADRGGIRFTTSPILGDLDGAVSTWTLQDDIDAATPGNPEPTKPCLRVNCGDEVVVNIDAIPLCLTFGNLQSRAFPELVARNNELALITHARYAETRLLTRIGALSTNVSASGPLGAVRDFLVQVDEAAAGYRSRHRLSPSESLRVILPAWFKNMLRADLTMQMPGDGEQFTTGDNAVNAWFSARHINPSWTLDGEAASAGNPAQIFGAQNAGALVGFPSKVVWYLFSEGTFLFLDGGTLDLGLVRDSSLNATNDYKMFVETFEGVAKVGIESLRITSTLDVSGAVAGTVDPTTY